ncbi:hypothetical protein [Burkholderia anthina]|uniref:hypothetical protein n=1 Tax=Burkholderia anthina TaxID=179879 RepID=UPI0037BE865F
MKENEEQFQRVRPGVPATGPMTESEYVGSRGVRCPSCGTSSGLRGEEVEIEDGAAFQRVGCGECGATWSDLYRLVSYSELEGGLPVVASEGKQPVIVQPIPNVRVRADGDANFYHLLDANDWVAAVQLNGKFTTPMQEAIMQMIGDVLKNGTTPKLTEWTDEDCAVADEQGWNLFNIDDATGRGEIQRDDEVSVFASDDAAIEFVRKRAEAGDLVAVKALEIVGLPVPEADTLILPETQWVASGKLQALETFLRTTHADQGGDATFGNWVRATAGDAQEFGHLEAVEYLRLGGDLRDKDLCADGQWTLQDASREIRLWGHGIVITVSPLGAGAIQSSLHKAGESLEAKAALDGVESMILAHAVAGIDVNSPAYLAGIETAVEAIWNQYGDEPESKCETPSPGI